MEQIGTNNVGILIDRSGSMQGLESKVVETVNSWINKIREESSKGCIPTVVSLATFDDRFEVVIDHSPVNTIKGINKRNITPRGMTKLLESSVNMMNLLIKGSHKANETFLLIVATDGNENASGKGYVRMFQDMVKDYALSGRWTIVFLCPPYGSKQQLMRYGVFDDNIMEWEGKAGLEYSRGQTISSMDSYYDGLTRGVTATKTFFQKVTTDLSKATAKVVKAQLQDETNNFVYKEVGKESIIQPFVESTGFSFYTGRTFYQLMKTEKVQPGKAVLVMDKGNKKIYGGQYARQLIGLDDPNTNYKVTPGNHANYEIFVQSKSTNRILPRGTKVLIRK